MSVEYPSIWAVVPCFNRTVNTLRFLRKFKEQDYPNKHVIIVDDASNDNTGFNVLLNYPNVHVIFGEGDLWWSGGTNLGVKYALEHGADYVFTINDDSQFGPELISSMYRVAAQDERYIVGAVIVEQDRENIIWSIGTSFDFDEQRLMRLNFAGENISVLASLEDPYPVEFMPANGVLIPSPVFDSVGLYDEISMPQYHADSEFILRASRWGGYKPVISLRSRIVNQILKKPLVNNVSDLLFFRKSDMYWPALATLLLRFAEKKDLSVAFNQLYGPFGLRL